MVTTLYKKQTRGRTNETKRVAANEGKKMYRRQQHKTVVEDFHSGRSLSLSGSKFTMPYADS
jgi:hypothetical protein